MELDKIPLKSVTLSTSMRPLFGNTHFANRGFDNWEMYLRGEAVHIIDQSSRGHGHGIIHMSSCAVEVEPGFEFPKKRKRGRPPKAKAVN